MVPNEEEVFEISFGDIVNRLSEEPETNRQILRTRSVRVCEGPSGLTFYLDSVEGLKTVRNVVRKVERSGIPFEIMGKVGKGYRQFSSLEEYEAALRHYSSIEGQLREKLLAELWGIFDFGRGFYLDGVERIVVLSKKTDILLETEPVVLNKDDVRRIAELLLEEKGKIKRTYEDGWDASLELLTRVAWRLADERSKGLLGPYVEDPDKREAYLSFIEENNPTVYRTFLNCWDRVNHVIGLLSSRMVHGETVVPPKPKKVRNEKEVEEEKGGGLKKGLAVILGGLVVTVPLVYAAYRHSLKTTPPVITSIGYAQSAPISGDVYKYQDLRFRKPISVFLYVNAQDPKGINMGISSVTLELFGSNRTMESLGNGTYAYEFELSNLTGDVLRGLTLLRDTVAIPFKVYARDADGNVACNESMIPLEFREVVIKDVPLVFQKDPKKGCYEAVATSILNYWGINATFDEIIKMGFKKIPERYWVKLVRIDDLEIEPQVMIIMGIPVMLDKEWIINNETVLHIYAGVGFLNESGNLSFYNINPSPSPQPYSLVPASFFGDNYWETYVPDSFIFRRYSKG